MYDRSMLFALLLGCLLGLPADASAQDRRDRSPQDVQKRSAREVLTEAGRIGDQLERVRRSALRRSTAVRRELSARQRGSLRAVGRELAERPGSESALRPWERFVEAVRPEPDDVAELVQGALAEAYRQASADLSVRVDEHEDRLEALGDDAELESTELQDLLEKQRDLLEQISRISKMLHESALAVIRRIGG